MKWKEPIFLLVDGSASDITPRVIAYTGCQKIILIKLVAQSSQMSRSLDLYVFGLFKILYKKEPKTKNSKVRHGKCMGFVGVL
jgi:hypothetical protein